MHEKYCEIFQALKRALCFVGLTAGTAMFFVGCLDDKLVTTDTGNGPFDSNDDLSTDIDTNNPQSTDSDSTSDRDSDPVIPECYPPAGPKQTCTSDYAAFSEANDTWAPQGLSPPQTAETHPGFDYARCYDCHAESSLFTPAGHDPRMLYWPWSCARGFPGSVCHGHGINGTVQFNHAEDPYFASCTKPGCHDTFNVRKDRENHGMNDVPSDAYCNACHQFSWQGWPEQGAK
jgi:hypothetical protein